MSITINTPQIREVLNQVVNDPDYLEVSKVPLISWQQISLVLIAYVGFVGGILTHTLYDVSLWILAPIMGFASYIAFTPLHDATHRAVSSNKTLNDLLGSVSAFLLFPFLTTPVYRFLHMSHHRYVGDDDLDPDSILVAIPTRYFPFGFLILPVFDVLWIHWALTKARFRMPPPVLRWFLFSSIGFIGFYIGGFVFFGLDFLLLYVLPSRIGMAYTAYSFATIQHPDGVKWNELPFESTHVLKGREKNLFIKTLLGQGYHAMHHFLPHVPWYKYQKVWELGNQAFANQPIPERSFIDTLEKDPSKRFRQARKQEIHELQVVVQEVKQVADDIKSFTFCPVEDATLPPFSAGAHIEVKLPSGKKRNYSLINAPYETHRYQIAVKKESQGKGGSIEMHDSIKEGTQLTISVPKNNFLLYEQAKRFILISGGIGITPLLSMAHRLDELDKPFELHICAKDENEIPFRSTLDHWSFAPSIEYHIDQAAGASIDLPSVLAGPNKDTLVYVCGPAGFNRWVTQAALDLGWPKHQLKQELFSADTSSNAPAKAFDVVLQKSGKTVHVPAHMSIIDAVEMHKIPIDYSCLQGTCGTCVCRVTEGEVDHRDAVLSEDEKLSGELMCLCVSRAKGDTVTVDL